MAVYPCQHCDQRFEGDAQNAYFTLYSGDAKASFRFIICPGCVQELSTVWVEKGLHRTAEGDWALPQQDLQLEDAFVGEPKAPYARTGLPWDAQGVRKRK